MTTIETRLPSFEDTPVVRSSVRITKAGDGLSEALKFEPEALHYRQQVYFVLRGEVTQINHRPATNDEDDDLMVRVHTVEAREIALVTEAAVEHLLESERTRLKRLQDKAESRTPLPGLDGDDPAQVENVGGAEVTNIFGGHPAPGPDEAAAPRRPRKGSEAAQLEAIAALTDPADLFLLMDDEEKGKNRQAVLDAASARISVLAGETA